MGGPVFRETESAMCTSYNTELLTTLKRCSANRIEVSVRNGQSTYLGPVALHHTEHSRCHSKAQKWALAPCFSCPVPHAQGKGWWRQPHTDRLAMINF